MNSKAKTARRQNIRFGIRKKINGTAAKPRLSVFRSNTEIYAQLIDDVSGQTLAAASSKEKALLRKKQTNLKKQAGWFCNCSKSYRAWFDRSGF